MMKHAHFFRAAAAALGLAGALIPAASAAEPQGTLVVYVENQTERQFVGDTLMDAGLSYLKGRYSQTLVQAIPSSRFRIFTGADYVSGRMRSYFKELADDPGAGPVDFITLSHSAGDGVQTPRGYEDFSTFFLQIPKELEPRLRLFYNAGCYGAEAKSALPKGFVVSLGTEGESIGPVALDEFLTQYVSGKSALEIARAVNAATAGSSRWTAPFAIYALATGSKETRREYVRDSGMKVDALPGGEAVSIATGQEELEALRRRAFAHTHPDASAAPAHSWAPPGLGSLEARLVRAEGESALQPRLRLGSDGNPLLPGELEAALFNPEITQAEISPFTLLGNSVLSYERDLDRGIRHEVDLARLGIPVCSFSTGGKALRFEASAKVWVGAGVRFREERTTPALELGGKGQTGLTVARKVSVGGAADGIYSFEQGQDRPESRLGGWLSVPLSSEPDAPSFRAAYTRFFNSLFKDDSRPTMDAATLGLIFHSR